MDRVGPPPTFLTGVMARGAQPGKVCGMAESPILNEAPRVLRWEDETQYAANGIVSRTVARSGGSSLVLFGFDAGAQLTEHTTTRPAIVQILSGTCDFSLAGDVRRVVPGDVIYMPPNLPHALVAAEKFSMLLTLLAKPEASKA